ncbi:hypothetical protein J4209_03560 [Candidatus Woesearchaeota archaeon]|nr:hypothetical protein [Candidatus Woesearchaeota archaeon]
MHTIFDYNTLIIKEHVRFLKLNNVYEIFSEQNQKLGDIKEETAGIVKFLKLTSLRKSLPFVIAYYNMSGQQLLKLKRAFTFFLSKINVYQNEQLVGYYKQRFRIKPTFEIYDKNDKLIANIKGNFIAWDFKIEDINGNIIGGINKKWAGLAKELFTSADNYVIRFHGKVDETTRRLIMSAAASLDMVYKEH